MQAFNPYTEVVICSVACIIVGSAKETIDRKTKCDTGETRTHVVGCIFSKIT